MKIVSISLSFLILTCLASTTYAAHPRLSKSTLSKSIDQPVIAAVFRDRLGTLWIGTQEGLYKFDGANLVLYNSDGDNKNWIPSSDIRGITADFDGNVLVATYGGGLLKWSYLSNKFSPYWDSDPNRKSQLTSLHVGEKGLIWASTKDELVLYNLSYNGLKNWLTAPDTKATIGKPHSFLESDTGELIVGSNRGLFRISTDKRTITRYDLSSLDIQNRFGVTALIFDKYGNIVIGTDTGHIARIKITGGRILAQATLGSDPPKLISDFSFFEDELVIATDKGLYLSKLDLSSIENVGLKGAGLSSSDITSLYQDGDLVWVGTYNGLDILSLAAFELFNTKNSGIHNDVLSFEQDVDSRLWAGTYGGLFLYDDTTKSHQKFETLFDETKLIDQRVTALAASKDDLWIGFYRGGVQVINTRSGTAHVPNIKNSSEMFIMDISQSSKNGNVWIATQSHGLVRITPDETYYYYDDGLLPEEGVSVIFERMETILFVTTTNKIYQFNRENDQFSKLQFDFGFGADNTVIFSVGESLNGDILFGTKDHGLFSWKKIDQNAGLFQLNLIGKGTDLEYSTIYGISVDSSDSIWCSTQSGVVKLDSKGQLIKKFTITDGLQGGDYSFGASFTDSEGFIYFGGMNGYNRFDPNTVEIDSASSPMRLTGVTLPGRHGENLGSLDDLELLALSHKDRFVTFQFSVLDFIDTDKNQFRYKLDNFDTEWIENGPRNTATYTSLPAGNYTLRVQGANSAGIWNRVGISLDIQVLPAPWYSWWAWLSYGIAFVFLLWCFRRITRSYTSDRENDRLELEMFEAENRADDDMQEQLEFQDDMVHAAHQHNLTTLSLVGHGLTSRSINFPEEIKRSLTESSIRRIAALSALEDCLSYQAGGSFANLEKFIDGIFPTLINDAPVKADTLITINEVTSMPIPTELASPISIIMYELLENSFQHAFDHNSPANYIHVKLTHETTYEPLEHFLELTCSDSGIGIPANIEEISNDDSGISIVQNIVKQLGGTLEVFGEPGVHIYIKIPFVDDVD